MVTQKQYDAAKLLEGALRGDAADQIRFVEGISTSDLPVQLSPTLTKIALETYAEQETIWRSFAGTETLPDFGTQEYYAFTGWGDEDVERSTGGDTFVAGGLPTVPEYDEYARLRFEAAGQNLKLKKSGVAVQFSWELLRSTRNFGLIQRAFSEFGRRSAVKEDHEATKQLLSATNFSAANQNIATGNPALSVAALEAAFQQVATQTDAAGNRVVAPRRWALVVPPALELTAQQILTITGTDRVETDGTTEIRYRSEGNPVSGRVSVVSNPYLPLLGGNDTNWWLIPVPGTTPNPSVVNLFLQGYQTPQIFVKRTTASAPEEGDFIDDSYETKVRHVVTGEFIDSSGTLKSDGTGA